MESVSSSTKLLRSVRVTVAPSPSSSLILVFNWKLQSLASTFLKQVFG